MSSNDLIRFPELKRKVGLGRTKIYEMIGEGSFPAPVKIGRASLWKINQVDAWIEKVSNA